jgi:hypothetical protein
VKRELADGFELDDDPRRIDVDAVHRYLSEYAYWAVGRARETVERLREAVENGPHARLRWLLHTRDAQELYGRFGFGPPSDRVMERRARADGT